MLQQGRRRLLAAPSQVREKASGLGVHWGAEYACSERGAMGHRRLSARAALQSSVAIQQAHTWRVLVCVRACVCVCMRVHTSMR